MQRARPARQLTNVSHEEWQIDHNDEWQALASLHEAAERSGAKFTPEWTQRDALVTRLKEKGAYLQQKAKSTRSFLRARRGGIPLPSGMIPQSLRDALTSEDRLYWLAAIAEERGGLEKKGVFAHPSTDEEKKEAEAARPITSRYHFDIKLRAASCEKTGPTYVTLPDGRKVRYKARLHGCSRFYSERRH